MPILESSAPLPDRLRRIAVAGTSGSGKTTLAGELGRALDIEHTEIDALFHGPGWTPRPTFEADVAEFLARESWITEWQYSPVRPAIAAAADLMVWIDLPTRVVMSRVVRRTLRRRLRREELWNGNVEPPLHTMLTDDEHIIRWAWRTRNLYGPRMERLVAERPAFPIVRLTSTREVDDFTARVRRRANGQEHGHVDR